MENNEIRGKFSEEDIWEAYQALNLGILGIEKEKIPVALGILSDAISELIALRRRLAKFEALLEGGEEIARIIAKNCDEYGSGDNEPLMAADAIIKFIRGGAEIKEKQGQLITEEAWVVWSPIFENIIKWSLSGESDLAKRTFIREMNTTHTLDWEDFYRKGYRIIPIKITYQGPE